MNFSNLLNKPGLDVLCYGTLLIERLAEMDLDHPDVGRVIENIPHFMKDMYATKLDDLQQMFPLVRRCRLTSG